MAFTFNDMKKCAAEAWGPLGSNTADRWAEFNSRFFAGKLRPVPIVITNTQPFGNRIGYCSHNPMGRCICLNRPTAHSVLVADNATLLHEMIHQALFERGEDAAHASPGWRSEIMRLNRQITGTTIWAGKPTTARRTVRGVSRVVRINKANVETGDKSLSQGMIARWPHSLDINLGALGSRAKADKRQRRSATGDW